MTDAQFLNWIADRFVHIHNESETVDFVRRLRILAAEAEQRGLPRFHTLDAKGGH